MATLLCVLALAAAPSPWRLSDEGSRALDAVSADSLRGHLSFLASDALGGRVTPSIGQDIAAEYIAAHLRGAGLDPLGDDGYFQTAPAVVAAPRAEGFRFSIAWPHGTVEIAPDAFRMRTVEAVALEDVPVVKRPLGSTADLVDVAGQAVLTELEEIPAGPGRREAFQKRQQWMRAVLAAGPAVVVAIDRAMTGPSGYFETTELVEPASASRPQGRVVTTFSPELARAYEGLPVGRAAGRLTMYVAEPQRERIRLRNVAGVLRGSDPRLADTYVLVTAHYDGTGPRPGASGPDRVWNGANDDGSGTVAVIELASALSRLHPRPRRSIVFMAFFGEEQGLVGSTYYAAHPLVPLARTVVDLNLEHLGRTDSTEGRSRAGTASLTGFDFSDLSAVVQAAGRATGIDVYKDARRSDPFFAASDNYPLAKAGVVAHTVSVLYDDWADYHGPGDEWPKVDFANMERTVRMAGAAVLMMADAVEPPHWRADVPAAAPFRDAAHDAR
jgi:hypothetical protein